MVCSCEWVCITDTCTCFYVDVEDECLCNLDTVSCTCNIVNECAGQCSCDKHCTSQYVCACDDDCEVYESGYCGCNWVCYAEKRTGWVRQRIENDYTEQLWAREDMCVCNMVCS